MHTTFEIVEKYNPKYHLCVTGGCITLYICRLFFLVNSVHTIWWNVNISINLFIEFNKNFLTMFHLTCKIIQCLHDGLTLKINKN
jgi:hypothetical protein